MLNELDAVEKAKEFIECGHAATYDQVWGEDSHKTQNSEKVIRMILELVNFHLVVRGFVTCLDISEEEKDDLLLFSQDQIYGFINYHDPKQVNLYPKRTQECKVI